ncbi:MAG: prolipoprotein diacylglyceryl transferase [Bdellovibrionota bacterium]
MYPILFEWGSFILPAWHVFYVLGAIAAYYLMIFLAKKHYSEFLKTENLSRLFVVCYISGYFGARLLSIFIDEPHLHTFSERLFALFSFGPMTFYGGFIAASICGAIYIVIRGISLRIVLDVAMPAGLLALAIGRIGCFLNGDDFGKPVSLMAGEIPPWWSVSFPNLEDGIYRYPVQLMSTVFVGLFVILICWKYNFLKKRFFFGAIGCFCAVGYALLRFVLEYFRGDPRGWFIENLISPSQFISLLVFIVSIFYLFFLKMKSRQVENL